MAMTKAEAAKLTTPVPNPKQTAALFAAVIAGDVDAARLALENGADVNAIYESGSISLKSDNKLAGCTPLHIAVKRVDKKMVALLLTKNPSPAKFADYSTTLLNIIRKNGIADQAAAIEIMLMLMHKFQNNADVNILEPDKTKNPFTAWLLSLVKIQAKATDCFSQQQISHLTEVIYWMVYYGADIIQGENLLLNLLKVKFESANSRYSMHRHLSRTAGPGWQAKSNPARDQQYSSEIYPKQRQCAREIIAKLKMEQEDPINEQMLEKVHSEMVAAQLPPELFNCVVALAAPMHIQYQDYCERYASERAAASKAFTIAAASNSSTIESASVAAEGGIAHSASGEPVATNTSGAPASSSVNNAPTPPAQRSRSIFRPGWA